MGDMHFFVLGAVIMMMISASAVHGHECDCSKYTKEGNGCGMYTTAVQECVMAASQLPDDITPEVICRMYDQTVACMASAAATCDNPPADSKQWTDMWATMEAQVKPLCSSDGGEGGCDGYTGAVQRCIMAANQVPDVVTPDVLCRIYNETSACMASAAATCDNPPADSKQWTDMWATMEAQAKPMCSGGSGGSGDNSCASFDMQAADCVGVMTGGTSIEEICQLFDEASACMDPLLAKCPDKSSGEIGRSWQMLKDQMQNMPC